MNIKNDKKGTNAGELPRYKPLLAKSLFSLGHNIWLCARPNLTDSFLRKKCNCNQIDSSFPLREICIYLILVLL